MAELRDFPDQAFSGVHHGPLQAGEWITLQDSKGRRHSVKLERGKVFHTTKGGIAHDDLIDGDGRPHALVSETAVAAVTPNQRPWTTVSEVSSRIAAGHIIGVNDTGEEILATLREHPSSEYLVLDADGGVYGVLATSDVERAFRGR